MTDTPLSDAELARLRDAFARVPYAQLLGIRLAEAGRGTATCLLSVREELTRMEGIVHGGAVASLLDTASAFAVLSLLEPGERTVTVDLTIHFLRPARQGEVRAQARVLRAGRRLVSVAIDATDVAGTLIATALTTYARTA